MVLERQPAFPAEMPPHKNTARHLRIVEENEPTPTPREKKGHTASERKKIWDSNPILYFKKKIEEKPNSPQAAEWKKTLETHIANSLKKYSNMEKLFDVALQRVKQLEERKKNSKADGNLLDSQIKTAQASADDLDKKLSEIEILFRDADIPLAHAREATHRAPHHIMSDIRSAQLIEDIDKTLASSEKVLLPSEKEKKQHALEMTARLNAKNEETSRLEFKKQMQDAKDRLAHAAQKPAGRTAKPEELDQFYAFGQPRNLKQEAENMNIENGPELIAQIMAASTDSLQRREITNARGEILKLTKQQIEYFFNHVSQVATEALEAEEQAQTTKRSLFTSVRRFFGGKDKLDVAAQAKEKELKNLQMRKEALALPMPNEYAQAYRDAVSAARARREQTGSNYRDSIAGTGAGR